MLPDALLVGAIARVTAPGGGTIATYARASSITSSQTAQAFSGLVDDNSFSFFFCLEEGASAASGAAAVDDVLSDLSVCLD